MASSKLRRRFGAGRDGFGTVGVGPDHGELAVPQRGQVDRDLAGHAHHDHLAAGLTMASDWASESDEPTQSKTTSAPSVSRPASTNEPDWRRTARASWSGATTVSAPSGPGQAALVRVLGPHHDGARRHRSDQVIEGGHHGQSQGAGPDHGHGVPVGDAGGQDGVDGAGGGLDHHGVLVGEGRRAPRGVGRRGPPARRPTSRRRCRRRTRSAGPVRDRRRPRCRTDRCGPRHSAGTGAGCRGEHSRAPAR